MCVCVCVCLCDDLYANAFACWPPWRLRARVCVCVLANSVPIYEAKTEEGAGEARVGEAWGASLVKKGKRADGCACVRFACVNQEAWYTVLFGTAI